MGSSEYMLGFDIPWQQLYKLETLEKLDQIFLQRLEKYAPELAEQSLRLRNHSPADSNVYSELLLEITPFFEEFIAELFLSSNLTSQSIQQHVSYKELYKFKRNFVQRRSLHKYPNLESLAGINTDQLLVDLTNALGVSYDHKLFAHSVNRWLLTPDKYQKELEMAEQWAAYQALQDEYSALFTIPKRINYLSLDHILQGKEEPNTTFDYNKSDQAIDHAMLQSHYCLHCHKQEKDSCRKGLKELQSQEFKTNDLGNVLSGCPLDQKISEMIQAKSLGYSLSALAIAMIDNPLICMTGHRICNDCSKSCIFQKQDHVDVPSIESEVFSNVIDMSWGVEIYNLLLLWNPLNTQQPILSKPSNKSVLVAGLGPAGFSMAYYLLRCGHSVTAIDGLKIEPNDLPTHLPIIHWRDHAKKLTKLHADGFGGVAQYGITTRWDKNNLRIVRLILERFQNFQMFGGTMLGRNFTMQQAFSEMGFDYTVLAFGAGSPNVPNIPKILSKRIWTAADFLMNLNLQKPYLDKSMGSLQIRLPLIVIGAGLTAVDSAVEAVKYYIALVEKFERFYNSLSDASNFITNLSEEDQEIALEYLEHAKLLGKSKNKAQTIAELGGVKILYRKSALNAPAYRLNHEELKSAFNYKIELIENAELKTIDTDRYGAIESIHHLHNGIKSILKARTMLIATGTNHIKYDFAAQELEYRDRVAMIGDMDPKYHGSVVKALASSKDSYEAIDTKLHDMPSDSHKATDLKSLLKKEVVAVKHHDDYLLELTVCAPLCVSRVQPGQFFKLQLYQVDSKEFDAEPIALSPTAIDRGKGLLTFLIYKAGGSTSLCRNIQVGDQLSLMGPVGKGLEVQGEEILLIGENSINNVVSHIGEQLKTSSRRITHLAYYSQFAEVIHQSRIENADQVIWCGKQFDYKIRTQDMQISELIFAALEQIANKKFTQIIIALSYKKLAELQSLWPQLALQLADDIKIDVLLFAPMQCMMQGQCGRCLQVKNNARGTQELFFSCRNQYLPIQQLSIHSLSNRLQQNSLCELLAKNSLNH